MESSQVLFEQEEFKIDSTKTFNRTKFEELDRLNMLASVCVCLCVLERERDECVCVSVSVCVC